MEKSDLKYGNVVETREGIKYLFTFHDEEDIFVDLTGDGYYYFESLSFNSNYKNSAIVIMKVYKDYTLTELLWERKEKPKLNEDEKAILRNLPKKYKWIARDSNDFIYIFREKPCKHNDIIWSDGYKFTFLPFDKLFQFIKWEDEEPCSIEDLLEGEEK